jgi:deoxycytidine triphosphate deaminase
MARILPDREIVLLLNKLILDGSSDCVRSNSYELRLGNRVKFDSTGEEMALGPGQFVEIQPGDFVTISSAEKLNFSRDAVAQIGKNVNLTGLITPTTTMMREGFLFTTTKVDPGFRGMLNWGIRNSSTKTVRLKHGERLFKLTLYELGEDEIPDKLYGDRQEDTYQDADGITPSTRMIPADIPDRLIVRRTERRIDPTKQLLEAGHPFSHIGTELINLHGKFEVVSKDVVLLKGEFKTMQASLETKIDSETKTLSRELQSFSESLGSRMRGFFSEQFDAVFDKKMLKVYGTLITIGSFGAALYEYVMKATPPVYQAMVFLGIGLVALLATLLLGRK